MGTAMSLALKILAGVFLVLTLTSPYQIAKNLNGWVGVVPAFSKGWKAGGR
jgi:hypothetical protein